MNIKKKVNLEKKTPNTLFNSLNTQLYSHDLAFLRSTINIYGDADCSNSRNYNNEHIGLYTFPVTLLLHLMV